MQTSKESRNVCFLPFSTPVLTLLIPGRHAQRSSWVINRLNAHADTRENAFPKFMHQVRHGISTTFELLPCQSRVARQTLSNLIVLPHQIKNLFFRLHASAVLMSNLIRELTSSLYKNAKVPNVCHRCLRFILITRIQICDQCFHYRLRRLYLRLPINKVLLSSKALLTWSYNERYHVSVVVRLHRNPIGVQICRRYVSQAIATGSIGNPLAISKSWRGVYFIKTWLCKVVCWSVIRIVVTIVAEFSSSSFPQNRFVRGPGTPRSGN